MKFEVYLKIKVSSIKWFLGRIFDEIKCVDRFFFFSDDEGSEEDEEEYDEDEDNDEDYEDEEGEEDEEDAESPSFFFGKNPIQEQAWNNFQLGANKTTTPQEESVGGLSSMISNFNICSPFSFGSQVNINVL